MKPITFHQALTINYKQAIISFQSLSIMREEKQKTVTSAICYM